MDKAYDLQPTLRATELRKNATRAELTLWDQLRNRQVRGVRFNFQRPIGPYICDFVARTPKLIVEVDGGQHALNVETDARRTAFLKMRGYRLIRFWNNDVLENIEGVVAAFEQALADRPSPTPPGNGRGL